MNNLKRFTGACIEAMYFADTGEEGQPASDAEIHAETLLDIKADCRSFWRRFGCYIVAIENERHHKDYVERAGHDFWLTRNGHGAGFWDGDWPKCYESLLTDGAKGYGPFEIYEDVRGRICA